MALKISIITGFQEGAERAALDWALTNSIPHGGWRPQRLPDEEALDPKYKLKEAETADVLGSVENNVRDSDATVIFTVGPKTSGPAQKANTYAKKQKKPVLHVHRAVLGAAERVVEFMDKHYIRRLHVTGSTEAAEPGAGNWVSMTLDRVKSTFDRRPD
ncbi:MAG: hypothetical protein JNG86_12630 [Verrucomicrobiaceae bacterium]|nr:hypothetical protein [Verrucomicrobiaceae bacterium]